LVSATSAGALRARRATGRLLAVLLRPAVEVTARTGRCFGASTVTGGKLVPAVGDVALWAQPVPACNPSAIKETEPNPSPAHTVFALNRGVIVVPQLRIRTTKIVLAASHG
jgi:hypothetical protein